MLIHDNPLIICFYSYPLGGRIVNAQWLKLVMRKPAINFIGNLVPA